MKEAIGGTLTISIIIFFLVLINGYLAFSVNYTKAFRVKNKVISLIEQNEGWNTKAQDDIRSYLDQVNYVVPSSYTNKIQDYKCFDGYCVKCNVAGNVSASESDKDKYKDTYTGSYYSVITFINIDIPILNKIFPSLKLFQIKGETKTIYSSGNNSELELCG